MTLPNTLAGHGYECELSAQFGHAVPELTPLQIHFGERLSLASTRLSRPLNTRYRSARWDVLAWNAAAADLITDFGNLPVEDRNILVYMLTDPAARCLFGGGWEAEARRMVALFRATRDLMVRRPGLGGIGLETFNRLPAICGLVDQP